MTYNYRRLLYKLTQNQFYFINLHAGLGKQEVRLAYVLNVDAINAAMDCLEQALKEYPNKTTV